MAGEAVIVKRILDGNTNAFEELVERYKNLVFKIVGNHVPHSEVDEISQVVFVKAYQALGSYRSEAPLEHWFARIAVRTCYDYWRAKKREREIYLESDKLSFLDSAQSIEKFFEELDAKKSKELLDWGMSKLSADDRMLVTLHHLEGYSEKETAGLLGWSVAKVKFRAFQSRKYLAKTLEKFFSAKADI